jgi:DNA repair photolyase
MAHTLLNMKRLLLTVGGKRCSFGCTYCFAEFSQYEAPPALAEAAAGQLQLDDVDVVYPACDVDLFAMRKRWAEVLATSAALGRSLSISTKAYLTREQVDEISRLAEEHRAAGLVLKVSVSASTMYSCEEIEPRAAGWDERLDVLQRLTNAGVLNSLVLKPVLAEIATAEYREMLTQAAAVTSAVVLGDEYVDDDPFRRRASQADVTGSLSSRRVGWIDGLPHWLFRESGDRLHRLAEHASAVGLAPYFSDLDFMERAARASRRTAVLKA